MWSSVRIKLDKKGKMQQYVKQTCQNWWDGVEITFVCDALLYKETMWASVWIKSGEKVGDEIQYIN